MFKTSVAVCLILLLTPLTLTAPAQTSGVFTGWVEDLLATSGLPPFGPIGENAQALVYNLTGECTWVLIVGPWNGWTPNEFPFQGYYWNGTQWVNNPALAKGLVANTNDNCPTAGFNVTGDGKFDLIVGGSAYSSPPYSDSRIPWTGYFWNGTQWVQDPRIVRGLSDYVGGPANNYASLGYNLLKNGRWNLLVDNYNGKGYAGFEWNGTRWTPQSALIQGLPDAGSSGTNNQFPIPCIVANFSKPDSFSLIVGLASGGGPIGALQGYDWTGLGWNRNDTMVHGATGLQPWPNAPSIAFNVTGNGKWLMLIGSADGPYETDYYKSFYWQGGTILSIKPLWSYVWVGQAVVFNATVSGGPTPYKFSWYVNGTEVPEATALQWVFTPTTSTSCTVFARVTDASGFTAQSETATILVGVPPFSGNTTTAVVVSPQNASVAAGGTIDFNATAIDFNNTTWGATYSVNWSISSGAEGHWQGNSYVAGNPGVWLVTADLQGVKGTATLTVTPSSSPPTASPNPTPSLTPTIAPTPVQSPTPTISSSPTKPPTSTPRSTPTSTPPTPTATPSAAAPETKIPQGNQQSVPASSMPSAAIAAVLFAVVSIALVAFMLVGVRRKNA